MKIDKKLILVPGFRKSGTTTIFDYLVSQGIGSEPKIKEPQILASRDWKSEKSFTIYKELFDNFEETRCIIDASTFLISDPKRIEEIRHLFSDLKIVVCIRDPIKRFFSAFWHHKGKNENVEYREISDVINQLWNNFTNDKADIEIINNDSCDLDFYGQNYLRNKYGLNIDYNCKDSLFPFRYYDEGNYSNYLNKLGKLGIDYHLIIFEDLIKEPIITLSKLEVYLECTFDNYSLSDISNSNKGYDRRSAGIFNKIKIDKLWQYLPQNIKDQIKNRIFRPLPEPQADHIIKLRELYKKELHYWENFDPLIRNKWKLSYEE
jgi:hypothetical protein